MANQRRSQAMVNRFRMGKTYYPLSVMYSLEVILKGARIFGLIKSRDRYRVWDAAHVLLGPNRAEALLVGSHQDFLMARIQPFGLIRKSV